MDKVVTGQKTHKAPGGEKVVAIKASFGITKGVNQTCHLLGDLILVFP